MVKVNAIDKRRGVFRRRYSGAVYGSSLNILLVVFILIASIATSSLNINWDVRAGLVLVMAFLYAEFVSYLAHRYQQHKTQPFQGFAFRMHTYWHHGMFSSERMGVDSLKDMNMVVLPFAIHGFVLGFVYLPIAFLVSRHLHSDLGWILMLGTASQLAWYELVHTLSHIDNPHVPNRLVRNHRNHHDHKLMTDSNFGIGTPLFDHLFGTYYKRD